MTHEQEAPLARKYSQLLSLLGQAGSAVLAFSGGVDSSFLLKAMSLSGMRFLAVTSCSAALPERDIQQAIQGAAEAGAEHLVLHTDELSNESFVSNPPDRCFFCKEGLYRALREIADTRDFQQIFDGTNADDLSDYRPGLKAASLAQVRSPLAEIGFSKEEIRNMSRELGLKTWDHPSSPCLASRFPYGNRITREGLRQVAVAEEFLRTLGFRDVRVRHHGDTARIEVADHDVMLLLYPENRKRIIEALKGAGFRFVSVDLEGYVSGSLNRVLNQ